MQIVSQTLKNGIRLVHFPIPGMVSHCGLVINAGSRDESEKEHGIAHFVEHMLFKGTSKRKAYHILTRLDDVGGELNAYTTKEETAVHASFLKEHYERAIELMKDLVFNSSFPPKEIEKEKEVIIEEINSYKDNPAELIFDEFEEQVFNGLAIGRNILGTKKSVKAFKRESLLSFISRNYSTDQIVFCSVGNIQENKIIHLFTKYFIDIPVIHNIKNQSFVPDYKPTHIIRQLKTYQNHCIIGNTAYDIRHKDRVGMFLLNNMLGGQGLNSRLNMSLRERNGLAYNVESNYNPYIDTGVFSIYFGTDKQNLEKSLAITEAELKKVRTEKLGSIQLSRAKSQIKGYLARGFENYESLMLSMGKSILVFDKIDSIEEVYEKIDEVTASQILMIANEVLDSKNLSSLIYK